MLMIISTNITYEYDIFINTINALFISIQCEEIETSIYWILHI